MKAQYPQAILSGIEYSQKAQQVAPQQIQKCIQVGDLVELAPKLAAQPYDIVVCSEVLEHLPDLNQALEAIVSLLKPKGLAVFTVPGGMRYWSEQDEVAGHYRRFEYEEFADLLQRNGLQIEHHYGWGGPFSSFYNRMISLVGPQRIMRHGTSLLSTISAKLFMTLFHVDDLFCSRYGFQLVTRARYL